MIFHKKRAYARDIGALRSYRRIFLRQSILSVSIVLTQGFVLQIQHVSYFEERRACSRSEAAAQYDDQVFLGEPFPVFEIVEYVQQEAFAADGRLAIDRMDAVRESQLTHRALAVADGIDRHLPPERRYVASGTARQRVDDDRLDAQVDRSPYGGAREP